MLRQLLDQFDIIPKCVLNEYSRYNQDRRGGTPDRELYTKLLSNSIKEFFKAKGKPVFILVDAYDELLSSKEVKTAEARAERLGVRSSLSLFARTDHVKVLITTREQYRKELQDTFPKSILANVRGDEDDMKQYLQTRLQLVPVQQSLKEEIVRKLLKANDDDKW